MIKKNIFTRHLNDINESYFEHMGHAFYFCRKCFQASIALLIHCILPFIFVTTGSSIISRLNKIMSARAQIIRLISGNDKHVAIIGFGLSGLLAFRNLVEEYKDSSQKLVIRIFEKSHFLAKGIAYSTKSSNHLLNVPACKMGVIPNDREHFFRWLVANGYNYEKDDFVPRQIFGIYLESILESTLKIAEQKGIFFEIINKKIDEIDIKTNHYIIDGNAYNHCILAIGTRLKNWEKNFWNTNLEKFTSEKEIHITGCGLTAFDALISLKNLNYQGKIFIHSRSGRLPQIHKKFENTTTNQPPLTIEDTKLPLSLIFKKFVQNCKNAADWRISFDAMRPLTQNFWKGLDDEKKKRFMRHCFRLWNIHRHKCPQSQFAIIKDMIDNKKVIFSKDRAKTKSTIDCSGFDYSFKTKLTNQLMKKAIVKPDKLNLGIISTKSNFYIIGGLNFGSSFEITAVPDITTQVQEVSEKILT